MTDSSSTIPVMNQPVNAMEAGLNSNQLQVSAKSRHPVDEMQRRSNTMKVSFVGSIEEQEIRHLYGTGFAMKLATERKLAHEIGTRGVAGLSTSNMMLDILTGNNEKLDFNDYLGRNENKPNISLHSNNPHNVMERTLGM